VEIKGTPNTAKKLWLAAFLFFGCSTICAPLDDFRSFFGIFYSAGCTKWVSKVQLEMPH
jgi:hypothetical protein